MQAYVFVDYDNVKPIIRENTDLEAEQNVLAIIDYAVKIVDSIHGDVSELVLRFYGGWTDVVGSPTERAIRLYRVLQTVARRVRGYRVSIDLVVSPILSGERLVGLWRSGGQKMVDTLMTADVTWCAFSIECPLIIMSDDDDLAPAAATAARIIHSNWARRPLCLSRARAEGVGLNDLLLKGCDVYFYEAI